MGKANPKFVKIGKYFLKWETLSKGKKEF